MLPKAIDRSGGAGFGRQENSADGRSEREKASAANTPGEGGTSAEGDPTSGVKSSGGGYVDDHWILLLQQVRVSRFYIAAKSSFRDFLLPLDCF